jgi:hypothetical protein
MSPPALSPVQSARWLTPLTTTTRSRDRPHVRALFTDILQPTFPR